MISIIFDGASMEALLFPSFRCAFFVKNLKSIRLSTSFGVDWNVLPIFGSK